MNFLFLCDKPQTTSNSVACKLITQREKFSVACRRAWIITKNSLRFAEFIFLIQRMRNANKTSKWKQKDKGFEGFNL